MTLSTLGSIRASQLGAMLFVRHISGARVVTGSAARKQVCPGFEFAAYGAHCESYPTPYLTAAAALGQTSCVPHCAVLCVALAAYDDLYAARRLICLSSG